MIEQEFINKLQTLNASDMDYVFMTACIHEDKEKIKYMLEDRNIVFVDKVKALEEYAFYMACLKEDKELTDYYLYSPTLVKNLKLENAILSLMREVSMDSLMFALINYDVKITPEIKIEINKPKIKNNIAINNLFSLKVLKDNLNKDLEEKDIITRVKL